MRIYQIMCKCHGVWHLVGYPKRRNRSSSLLLGCVLCCEVMVMGVGAVRGLSWSLRVFHLKPKVLWSPNLEKESSLQAVGRQIRKCQSITWGLLWVISWLTWLGWLGINGPGLQAQFFYYLPLSPCVSIYLSHLFLCPEMWSDLFNFAYLVRARFQILCLILNPGTLWLQMFWSKAFL